jgi:hypothetical protein
MPCTELLTVYLRERGPRGKILPILYTKLLTVFIIYPGSVNPSTKSQLLFNKIKISTHIPLFLANITNSHGINKMTYVAKSAFILAK